MKKALIVATVGGFLAQFEMGNASLLEEMGYEVHYASNFNMPAYGNESRLEKTQIICHQIDFERSPYSMENIRSYRQLKKLMTEIQFDVIHCHTPMGGVLGRLAAKRSRIGKIIYTAHGFHFYKGASLLNWLVYYPVEKLLSGITDALITINNEDYERAKKMSIGAEVYRIHGVGINATGKIHNTKKDRGKDGRFIILAAGELNRNKNHRVLIEAISEIEDERILLLICGKGELKEEYEQMIERLRCRKKVHLMGYCQNMKEVYEKADIFVQPSYREGLSVALMEAMAAGLPCIVSDIRGNRELIDDGIGGYRIKPNEVSAWKDAIKKMMLEDFKRMGKYNIEKICQYDKRRVKEEMRAVYTETLGGE